VSQASQHSPLPLRSLAAFLFSSRRFNEPYPGAPHS
jgi:hypothetical protein